MKTEIRTVGTVEVCTPMDALADEAAAQFCDAMRTCVGGANPRVVVDMTEVGYMDSAALEGMLDIADELGERGAQIKIAAITPTCREIMALTGLSGRFQFFEDVNAAVRSFL